MVGIPEIAGALSSLKATKDLLEAMVGLRDAATFQEKRIELQSRVLEAQGSVLAAQDACAAFVERIRHLEQEIARLKDWETDKQRYELKPVAEEDGPLAYALKPDAQGSEPTHHICANCYQQSQKSILQPETRYPGRCAVLVCHKCGSDLYVSGGREPGRERYRRS
jgi:hypothetical protein